MVISSTLCIIGRYSWIQGYKRLHEINNMFMGYSWASPRKFAFIWSNWIIIAMIRNIDLPVVKGIWFTRIVWIMLICLSFKSLMVFFYNSDYCCHFHCHALHKPTNNPTTTPKNKSTTYKKNYNLIYLWEF